MDILTASCHTCNAEVVVFGYWIGHDEDGRDQWELVEPPDHEMTTPRPVPTHHDHDVSITGRA